MSIASKSSSIPSGDASPRRAIRCARADSRTSPIVDQSQASGWTRLGTFLFEGDDAQFVRIFDKAIRPLEGPLKIVADAVRIVPVSVDGCEALPREGEVIRETSPCFHREGKKGWRTAADAGHAGSLIFTTAKERTMPVSWAMWRVLLANAGRYEVSVFVDPAYARFDAARYQVFSDGEIHPLRVDQSAADGWTSLGVYDFGGGTSQYVRVSDVSADTVVEGERRIAVDAVRVSPAP